jgi:hypothetical protein
MQPIYWPHILGETTLTEILVKFHVDGADIGINASGNERARTFPDVGATKLRGNTGIGTGEL